MFTKELRGFFTELLISTDMGVAVNVNELTLETALVVKEKLKVMKDFNLIKKFGKETVVDVHISTLLSNIFSSFVTIFGAPFLIGNPEMILADDGLPFWLDLICSLKINVRTVVLFQYLVCFLPGFVIQ